MPRAARSGRQLFDAPGGSAGGMVVNASPTTAAARRARGIADLESHCARLQALLGQVRA